MTLVNQLDLLQKMQRSKVTTLTELRLLFAIGCSPSATMTEIAKLAKIPYTSASRVAYTLSRDGLVAYLSVAGDRRVKLLALTKKGAALCSPFGTVEAV